MVVPSQRVLLISFLLLLVSTTLVHAKGKKQPAEDIGGAGGDDGGEDAVGDTAEDGIETVGKGGKKKLDSGTVTYDARSLMINGKRELLFSGSIHYPRSPVEVSF